MNWLTFRLLLGHVLPGALLTYVGIQAIAEPPLSDSINNVASRVLFFLLLSTIVGVAIDLVRRKAERIFIQRFNLFWFSNIFRRIERRMTASTKKVAPLSELIRDYDIKLAVVIRAWIQYRLTQNPEKQHRLLSFDQLESELLPTYFTSGDWYALAGVIEYSSLEWYMREYFAYYEFSFNFMVATGVAFPLLIVVLTTQDVDASVAASILTLNFFGYSYFS